jgi:hypothetical protein
MKAGEVEFLTKPVRDGICRMRFKWGWSGGVWATMVIGMWGSGFELRIHCVLMQMGYTVVGNRSTKV